jgi:hypothetical protein
VSIGELTVRYYFRRGNVRPEDIRPAGEVRVPAATVALRSTIPDESEVTAIRAGRAPAARGAWTGAISLAGLALLLVAIAPAVWWAIDRARRARPARPRDSARKRRAQHRAAFDDIRGIDPASLAELRDAYTRLDALVRDHVSRTFKVSAASLTPSEIEVAIAGGSGRVDGGSTGRVAADVDPRSAGLQACCELLRECERARYAPADAVPNRDAWRRAVETAGDLLGGGAA